MSKYYTCKICKQIHKQIITHKKTNNKIFCDNCLSETRKKRYRAYWHRVGKIKRKAKNEMDTY